jgi:hypothetical protein
MVIACVPLPGGSLIRKGLGKLAGDLWIQKLWKQNLEPTGVRARRWFSMASFPAGYVSKVAGRCPLIKDTKLSGYVETGRQGIFSGGGRGR